MEQHRADDIAEKLQESIFDRTIPDGSRLDEAGLAEQFGISGAALTEAIQRLALSGLVELVPRRGAFVHRPGPVELMEMFEVMAELEAACGRLAANRISARSLEDLRSANIRCQTAVDAGNPGAYYFENEQFHKIIYQQSGNDFLARQTSKLQSRLKPFRRHQLRFRGRMAQSLAEHRAIVDALENGDAVAAANTLRDHVAIQSGRFYKLLAVPEKIAD